MNIRLSQVRIENFRSIRHADVKLGQHSVMFGMNDSGKSNFLLALDFALNNKYISDKDVFRSGSVEYSTNTTVVVDLKFIPMSDDGVESETFNDMWGLHLGENVQIDENGKEFFAFRTKFEYDADRGDYRKERVCINVWDENIVEGKMIGGRTLSAFELVYLGAQRDIAFDIRDKTSMWSKQLSKIKMNEDAKESIENSLKQLSDEIMAESPFLQRATENLSVSTNIEDSKIDIHPITRTVEEIYKGLDIYVTQDASSAIPISNMGSGTRSRAVFASLKTVVNEKIAHATESPFFPIIALEEPEAHIHPQAQRKLIGDFSSMQGQRIITTHSPFILSSSNIDDLVYVNMKSAETQFSSLSELKLDDDEMTKVRRMVIDTNGEILFARLVILAEGDTERLALPIFFNSYFGCNPHEMGITITGIHGQGNYLPFLKVLDNIGVVWCIFSDGEQDVIKNLIRTMQTLHDKSEAPDLNEYENIIILDNSNNYEQYLVDSGYADEILDAINDYEGKTHENAPTFVEKFSEKTMLQPNASKCEQCREFVWVKANKTFCCDYGKKQALLACMTNKNKVKYAIPIAKKICMISENTRRHPPKIKILFERVKGYIGGTNEFIREAETGS